MQDATERCMLHTFVSTDIFPAGDLWGEEERLHCNELCFSVCVLFETIQMVDLKEKGNNYCMPAYESRL